MNTRLLLFYLFFIFAINLWDTAGTLCAGACRVQPIRKMFTARVLCVRRGGVLYARCARRERQSVVVVVCSTIVVVVVGYWGGGGLNLCRSAQVGAARARRQHREREGAGQHARGRYDHPRRTGWSVGTRHGRSCSCSCSCSCS